MDKILEQVVNEMRELRETLKTEPEKIMLDLSVLNYLTGKIKTKEEYNLCMAAYSSKGANYLSCALSPK